MIVTAELEVLPYLAEFQLRTGMMPTLAEIGTQFDRTPQWAAAILRLLEKHGHLTLAKHKHRAITLNETKRYNRPGRTKKRKTSIVSFLA